MIYGVTEIINKRKGRRRTFQYNGGWVTKEREGKEEIANDWIEEVWST